MQGYIMSAGHCGLTMSVLTYAGTLRICGLADQAIMETPKPLVDKIEAKLQEMIDLYEFTQEELENSTSVESPASKKNK